MTSIHLHSNSHILDLLLGPGFLTSHWSTPNHLRPNIDLSDHNLLSSKISHKVNLHSICSLDLLRPLALHPFNGGLLSSTAFLLHYSQTSHLITSVTLLPSSVMLVFCFPSESLLELNANTWSSQLLIFPVPAHTQVGFEAKLYKQAHWSRDTLEVSKQTRPLAARCLHVSFFSFFIHSLLPSNPTKSVIIQ